MKKGIWLIYMAFFAFTFCSLPDNKQQPLDTLAQLKLILEGQVGDLKLGDEATNLYGRDDWEVTLDTLQDQTGKDTPWFTVYRFGKENLLVKTTLSYELDPTAAEISEIIILSDKWQTSKNIKVGSSLSALQTAYSKLEVNKFDQHPYEQDACLAVSVAELKNIEFLFNDLTDLYQQNLARNDLSQINPESKIVGIRVF